MLTSPIERANASSSIFCAPRACVCACAFVSHGGPSLFFLSLVTSVEKTLNQTFPFDSRLFLKIVTSAKERRRRQKQRQTMAAEEETTRKSHDDDEKDAGADVVVARETRTNDDDAQQINSSASSSTGGSSFSSKVFLLAFIGLSVALGLREDVGELVKGSGGIENETTRGETMRQKEDAISVGDRIHISFCQS